MKIITAATFFIFSFCYINAQTDTLTDVRDGKTYKTVKIGEQTWMAENLNFDNTGSYCYANKQENCDKYGRLYTWEAAKNVCPTGWHLPTEEEWQQLEKYLGMTDSELTKNDTWRGTDQGKRLIHDKELAFNILLAVTETRLSTIFYKTCKPFSGLLPK